jgi:hypothetical protein
MVDLSAARNKADKIRFSADIPASFTDRNEINTFFGREQFYQDAIEISALVTPKLWDHFCVVCERLEVPQEAVSPFIYSSKDVHAECYASQARQCILRFSSGLIDLLDEQEFEFVIGHELGHFLLEHHLANVGLNVANPEYFRQRRAQEISVDRLGLISCGSLDVALRALMKTVSGLTERHLRFDVGGFISQLRKVDKSKADLSYSTHPSIVIRAKALLWFSLSDYFQKVPSHASPNGLIKIDERIERDLHKFVDGAVRDKIASLSEELLLWMVTLEVVRVGMFSSAAQNVLRARFGEDTVQRLRVFLAGLSKGDAEATIFEKLKTARSDLEILIPRGFMAKLDLLEGEAVQLIANLSRI